MSVYPCPKCLAERTDLESACASCGWSPNQQRSTGTVASGTYESASPYAASSSEYAYQTSDNVRHSTQNTPTSLYLLLFAMFLTAFLAAINAIQELHPFWPSGLYITLISVISQIPGLLFATWYWRKRQAASSIMLAGAYFIAISGIAGYAIYVSRPEPADSINSAAHMHVVFSHSCIATLLFWSIRF